jgi:hypothetical protein
MLSIEAKQLVRWLRDKAARAPERSWFRMMNMCADRLERCLMREGCRKVHDYCRVNNAADLTRVLSWLDDSGYELVCVTAMDSVSVMVFFRRPVP